MFDLTQLQHRDDLGRFLNQHKLVGVGVEVGVKNGANARQIISTWEGKVLHLIDPWEQQDPSVYKERQDWTNFQDCKKECEQLRDEYGPRIILHQAYSPQVSERFANDFLSFAYIDGNHSYDAVTADLHAWWSKVITGGVIGCHDYYNDTNWPAHCEVKRAVDDWAAAIGVTVHHTPACGSVWFVK